MTTGGNSTTTLTLEEERQHLERLLAQHKRNLYRLEQVKAQKGLDTSIAILNELDYERQELARVQDMLRALEATPDPLARLTGQVRALLEAMGYQVTAEKPGGPAKRLLICEVPAAGLGMFQRVLLLCVDGEIGARLVEQMEVGLQAENAAQAILIAHTRLAPRARRAAGESGSRVRAFTLAEFYRQLIDFTPYVEGLVRDYEESELADYYMDLGCVKREYNEAGRVMDEDTYKAIDDYVDRWLGEMGRNHLSILGDYSTGKTSFCRQYAAKLGQRWLEDPDRWRIPLLISLRDYAKAMNLEQLITDFLVNRYGIRQASYRTFQRFNADGKLLLLFDGFDEMAQKTDYASTIANFWELAKAVVPGSKVLLTCRTPYFRTSREARALLRGQTSEVSETSEVLGEAYIDLHDRPNFEIVHLLPFSDDDIRLVLQKRFPERWEGYYTQIRETYSLRELAERPVLLDMITQMIGGQMPEVEAPKDTPEGMVYVPPGPFIMGGERGLPLQIARLEEGFFISRYPVTNAQYRRFVKAGGYEEREYWSDEGWQWKQKEGWTEPWLWGDPEFNQPDQPVVGVSWYEAEAYARWARCPELGEGGMRLPTEIEWEKAARGIDGREYPWGEWAENRCNSEEAGIGRTSPVSQFSPGGDSVYGLQDAAGNVWEWTASEWEAESSLRVLRGGSFLSLRFFVRCAYRTRLDPTARDGYSGFRVVVSPVSPSSAL